jgi:aminoglycoside phosphotransferase (APT) family kinase protein
VLDESRLVKWMQGRLPDAGGEITLHPLAGGSSNLLYRLDVGRHSYVVRTPPRAKYDRSSHNISREITLLGALGKTSVPHPRLLGHCDDADVVGVPFMVMTFVDGFSPVGVFPEPFEGDESARHQIGMCMVEALAGLANLNWQKIGLANFGRPEGFLERQVDRWMGQLARYQTRGIPLLEDLANWLRDNRPRQQRVCLMHGDYSFPNVMIARRMPVQIAAIVDWESSTIGDPLLDLGHLLAGWCDPGETETYLRDMNWHGMPTRKALALRYSELTGLSFDAIQYYRALALFKLSIILEGAYSRVIAGENDYGPHRTLEQRVPMFVKQAWGFTRAPCL